MADVGRRELAERAFRRYEPYIREAMLRFPEEVGWDLTQAQLSVNTFIARLRDAIRAHRLKQFDTDWECDFNKLAQLRCFIPDDQPKMVYITGKLLVKNDPLNAVKPTGPSGVAQVDPAADKLNRTGQGSDGTAYTIMPEPTEELIEAYAMLLQERLVGLPRLFIPRKPDLEPLVPMILSALEAQYDIAIVIQPNAWIVL